MGGGGVSGERTAVCGPAYVDVVFVVVCLRSAHAD